MRTLTALVALVAAGAKGLVRAVPVQQLGAAQLILRLEATGADASKTIEMPLWWQRLAPPSATSCAQGHSGMDVEVDVGTKGDGGMGWAR